MVTITKYLNKIKDLNVLVIGETIIDEYQYGYTLGKAGKFPIVAFQNTHLETYEGGILAIYNHLKDFCNVEVMTGIKIIIKKRYVQNGQKLFETYRTEIRYGEMPRLINIPDYDLVIVADFGHGGIDKKLRELIQEEANYLALNTQSNAGNMGMNTINKYDYADYVSIDENELRLATSNQYDNIEDIIVSRFHKPTVVSITLSKRGTVVFKDNNLTYVDAFENHPVDTVGAGDAYLAISSLLAYVGAPPDVIGSIGNAAGAVACGYQGNKEYVTKEKLLKVICDKDE